MFFFACLSLLQFGFYTDTAPFERHVFTAASGAELPYRLLLPEGYDPTSSHRYPLVVFLHGAGERGTDNELQLTHIAAAVLDSQRRAEQPAFVLVPQCPKEYRWVETDWKLPAHSQPEQPSVPMSALLELLDSLHQTYPIDTQCRYVMGLSMGGFGTWDILQRRPDYFAAGVPICGGGDEKKASVLADLPLWVFHGAKDKVVVPARSRNMAAALRNNRRLIYTEYPDVGHDSWKPALANPELWDWLFRQSRAI